MSQASDISNSDALNKQELDENIQFSNHSQNQSVSLDENRELVEVVSVVPEQHAQVEYNTDEPTEFNKEEKNVSKPTGESVKSDDISSDSNIEDKRGNADLDSIDYRSDISEDSLCESSNDPVESFDSEGNRFIKDKLEDSSSDNFLNEQSDDSVQIIPEDKIFPKQNLNPVDPSGTQQASIVKEDPILVKLIKDLNLLTKKQANEAKAKKNTQKDRYKGKQKEHKTSAKGKEIKQEKVDKKFKLPIKHIKSKSLKYKPKNAEKKKSENVPKDNPKSCPFVTQESKIPVRCQHFMWGTQENYKVIEATAPSTSGSSAGPSVNTGAIKKKLLPKKSTGKNFSPRGTKTADEISKQLKQKLIKENLIFRRADRGTRVMDTPINSEYQQRNTEGPNLEFPNASTYVKAGHKNFIGTIPEEDESDPEREAAYSSQPQDSQEQESEASVISNYIAHVHNFYKQMEDPHGNSPMLDSWLWASRPRNAFQYINQWWGMVTPDGQPIHQEHRDDIFMNAGPVGILMALEDYRQYQGVVRDHEYSHVLEMYGFSPNLKTWDVRNIFLCFQKRGLHLKWVHDTSVLLVFANRFDAQEAIQLFNYNDRFKLRRLSDGSLEAQMCAREYPSRIFPARPPRTRAQHRKYF